MKSSLRTLAITSAILFAGCTERTDAGATVAATKLALDTSPSVTVSLGARAQRLTGFGASSAWTTTGVTAEEADQLFTTQGLGISILRMRIAPDGSSQEMNTAIQAAERGVIIWAAPWSPPGVWKTNGSDTNGGSLKPENYQLWANRLAAFAGTMKTRGVPLFALSVQNEPDWIAEWETCVWTPDELVKFTRDYLAPALRLTSPETKILAPESANWNDLETFTDPFLAETGARAAIGIVGTHSYGGLPRAYPAAAQAGKEFWETEISYETADDITAAVGTAKLIHSHLTIAQVNAWHYWWINSDSTSSLFRNGVILPQANGYAHYARFVRPGYYRVSAEPRTNAGVSVSAFIDPSSPRVVVVAVNESTTGVTQPLDFGATTVGAVTPWLTDENGALVQGSDLPGGSTVSFDLPATSVVTLVTTRPFEGGTGGSGGQGTGGAVSTSGGATAADAGSAGSGGEASEEGGAGGAPASLGGATARGGASASTGGRAPASGGAKASGGRAPGGGGSSTELSGGTTSDGGLYSNAGNGGSAASGQLPQQPFLPGCYCSAAPATPSRTTPLWPGLVGVVVSLRGIARARRHRSARRA